MFKVSKRKTVALAIIGCALFSCSRNPEVKRIIDGVVPTDSISMRQVEIGTELLMPENIFVVKDKLVIYQSKADKLFTVFPLPFTGHSYAAGCTGRGPDEFIRIDVRSIVPYGDVFKVADADGMLKEVAIDSGRVDVISKTKMNLNQPYNGAFEMKDCYINMNQADEKYEYVISDKKTGEMSHVCPYPDWASAGSSANIATYMKYTVPHPDGDRLAAFYTYFRKVRIIDQSGKILRDITLDFTGGTGAYEPATASSYNAYCFYPTATGDYIAVNYYDQKLNGPRKKTTEIQIWNWDGELLHRLICDKQFMRFTIDFDSGILFAVPAHDARHLYIADLSGILAAKE